jgi:3-phenylpropionate/trans-cinnamate dioxygenase ferredoxin reductase subunit
MGGGVDELVGPDLRAGIGAHELTEGALLLGHADGEAVLLIRRGGEVIALGAKCTHYGGPLSEGVLDGDTIRCPWHHACFSIRTGEPLLAPALVDLPLWTVEESGGRIRVVGKREAPSLRESARIRNRRPATAPASVVILGAGAAGNAAAETLRREGYEGPVTLVDADADAPYDRPNLSKDYLAGTAPEEWIPLHPPSFYDENQITLLRGTVSALDVRNRVLELAEGARVEYGALLLAPGAEPIRLDLPSAPGAHVHYLRSLADSRAIIDSTASARRAVVLGASFIGLEVAASLRNRNVEVHVIAPEARPLERVLGAQLGDFIRQLHEQHGVVFHLGHTAQAIDADAVVLDHGERVLADLVVIGVGVRPRTALAQAAGLAVENGIVVDAELATSAPGVFAAGDAARFPDPRSSELIRIEHWVVAERMGQVAARNLLRARQRFTSAPFFWSQHYDAVIAYVGHAARWDDAVLDGDPAALDCSVAYLRGGARMALATIFRDVQSLQAELEWERSAGMH